MNKRGTENKFERFMRKQNSEIDAIFQRVHKRYYWINPGN